MILAGRVETGKKKIMAGVNALIQIAGYALPNIEAIYLQTTSVVASTNRKRRKMAISDEKLLFLVESDFIEFGTDFDYDDVFIMAKELLARRISDRWIPVSERPPEVGEIVQWTHKSWKRIKEGYLTGTGRLKVWGGEYASVPKSAMWKAMSEPPEAQT